MYVTLGLSHTGLETRLPLPNNYRDCKGKIFILQNVLSGYWWLSLAEIGHKSGTKVTRSLPSKSKQSLATTHQPVMQYTQPKYSQN